MWREWNLIKLNSNAKLLEFHCQDIHGLTRMGLMSDKKKVWKLTPRQSHQWSNGFTKTYSSLIYNLNCRRNSGCIQIPTKSSSLQKEATFKNNKIQQFINNFISGSKVDEQTGTFILFTLDRRDVGDYTCRAENNAGMIEATARLSVIIKPKVQMLENVTTSVGESRTSITCQASGEPLPRIIWRKWSRK